MITLDGSLGEGGGQIVRSALTLSLITGKSFRIRNIRAGRPKPGLMRQHLTAVRAATTVGSAEVVGAEMGSTELTFKPRRTQAGEYTFSVGTAGSTTLVLQTILLPLLCAREPSTLHLEGGTHNPFAPPYPFLEKSFLPLIRQMGFEVETQLERPGFYPAGGGLIHVQIKPSDVRKQIQLAERGPVVGRAARACAAKIPRSVAERELKVVKEHLAFEDEELFPELIENSAGPGNALFLEYNYGSVTEVFSSFGEYALPAEKVAWKAIEEARRFLKSSASVGEHLADQLLMPMAMAGGGSFRTLPPTKHTLTNIDVISKFLDQKITTTEIARLDWAIDVK
jgi:RNA 3'-terminal phosphate cyclase (ATP)